VRLEEFTTWIREQIRLFDKFNRECSREDPKRFPLRFSKEEYIQQFKDFIDV
jgi:hypothetical protein